MSYKRCIYCNKLLEVNETNFYKRAEFKDGFRNDCKECVKSKVQKRNFLSGKIKYTLTDNFIHTCSLKEGYILCKGKCQRILEYNEENFHTYITKSNSTYLRTTCKECILEELKQFYTENKELEKDRVQNYRSKRRKTLNLKSYTSKGEQRISKWLKDNNLPYKKEKGFDNCLSPKGFGLYFDFYLPHNNLVIEYDGEWHYKVIINELELEKQKVHDQLKTDFCITNNIKLLRIPYWELDNIESILTKNIIC